jgi:class 3 adenylate cyclase
MSTYPSLTLSEAEELVGHWPTPVREARVTPSQSTERKVVTVLFADVKNSMALSREVELEDWWSVSAGLLRLMCESADRFGGWVGEFSGDGVNAIFEIAEQRDHHARRACLAALWLRRAIQTLAASFRAAHALDLSVRIGLNSGQVLTGTMEHPHKCLYTVSGYPVALAKRIEALARPERIYLSEHTALCLGDAFQLHDLGAVEVRGADVPVRVFELLGSVSASRTRRDSFHHKHAHSNGKQRCAPATA